MSTLKFDDKQFSLDTYESVLDCLLRNGVAIPYACKAGMCQACLVRAVDCTATDESRKWIKPELQARGFTLACQWVPDGDVGVALPSVEDFALKVRLHAITPLNAQVLKLELALCDPAARFSCKPGQYVTLTNPAGVSRSYSVANDLAVDGVLELHIGSTAHGLFSGWVFGQARPGDILHLRGPSGSCHYRPEDGDTVPLLLAGNGTGLAPLLGIARQALALRHQAPIYLFHGGRDLSRLYLIDELQALASTHPNFHYLPCTREAPDRSGIHQGAVEDVVERTLTSLGKPLNASQLRAFLCGSPDLVHVLRKRLYLLGLRAANIHCDPFTERTVVASAAST